MRTTGISQLQGPEPNINNLKECACMRICRCAAARNIHLHDYEIAYYSVADTYIKRKERPLGSSQRMELNVRKGPSGEGLIAADGIERKKRAFGRGAHRSGWNCNCNKSRE